MYMKTIKNILFLGYTRDETTLIKFLEKKGFNIACISDKSFDPEVYDLIISFGYRHIIKESIIKKSPRIINLHISLLPFNRGAHPNFWSHYDNTPSGVTIHLIDKGIDTGQYLFQREVKIDTHSLSFRDSHRILVENIESLFKENYKEILDPELRSYPYNGKGTHHNSSDLPKEFSGWDSNIFREIKRLKMGDS